MAAKKRPFAGTIRFQNSLADLYYIEAESREEFDTELEATIDGENVLHTDVSVFQAGTGVKYTVLLFLAQAGPP